MTKSPEAQRYLISEAIEDAACVFVDLKRNPNPTNQEIHLLIKGMQAGAYLGHGMTYNEDYHKERVSRAVRRRIEQVTRSKKYQNENHRIEPC